MPLKSLARKIFGSRNDRQLKRLEKTVSKINQLESNLKDLTNEALQGQTALLQAQLANGQTVDDILPEAFAVVREAARRVHNMRHFDVQLIGGMALHQGQIAEMHTGEGKTLVATLPAYLNGLTGKGVHIVTVNDYLAQRDAAWMGPIYQFLGLTVGVIVSDISKEARKAAYAADITYGTNNEFGFDYLRDNMAFSSEDKVQRQHHFAIVDEVDSILIDEARTPLIISGPAEDSSAMYKRINQLIPQLTRQETEESAGDYYVDEKTKQVHLSEEGHAHVEVILVKEGILTEDDSLYAPVNISLLHHINAALRAHATFQRDVDYIVREGEVVIVDEHTGRTMVGRRWSDGLHQAVEAKEKVHVQNENQTLASITFQNYFRIYDKLAGMTGTADTEAYEFHQIYGLEVLVMPTNRANQRDDEQDLIYLSVKEKFDAVIEDIRTAVKKKQPVLVGTASIETSEFLSQHLKQAKVPHQVLNAKFHEYEAQIIAEAGRPGAVTIATNMAGRGTDIVLGGNLEAEINALSESAETAPSEQQLAELKAQWQQRHDQVLAAGGLRVIGSERHESRRIDNQLRGRSGRQGDPGSTRFYLSLDDDLMRRFAKPGMVNFMRKLHSEEGVPLQSGMISKGIENAQRKVEGQNFDIRKQLLQFDDVANEQRRSIYQQRDELIAENDVSATINSIRQSVLNDVVRTHIPVNSIDEQWDIPALEEHLRADFLLDCPIAQWLDDDDELDDEALIKRLAVHFDEQTLQKEQEAGPESVRHLEKVVMLQAMDHHWKEHLAAMDQLRQSVNLRGYAQKDPKQEYKREAFTLFTEMLERLKHDVISTLSRTRVRAESEIEALEQEKRRQQDNQVYQYKHASVDSLSDGVESDEEQTVPFTRSGPKIGRNDPCHCGSGKKYKQCHGQL